MDSFYIIFCLTLWTLNSAIAIAACPIGTYTLKVALAASPPSAISRLAALAAKAVLIIFQCRGFKSGFLQQLVDVGRSNRIMTIVFPVDLGSNLAVVWTFIVDCIAFCHHILLLMHPNSVVTCSVPLCHWFAMKRKHCLLGNNAGIFNSKLL